MPGALDKNEACVPSEELVLWTEATLAVVAKLRGLRAVTHECLDAAEKAGLIQQ